MMVPIIGPAVQVLEAETASQLMHHFDQLAIPVTRLSHLIAAYCNAQAAE